jgi:hypothetical protein
MAKNKQMVDDDQIENVGIMQGFMDDLDELMGDLDEETEADDEDDDESDIAKMLGRRPDSPEILMNNLRGDYRSIDARREELADLVGYNAAAETPDEVLAMLQPVLAKQGIAALPQAAPMPPEMGAPAGIEALPMAQGPMPGAPMPAGPMPEMPAAPQQAPVGMKKGGIVQFFQDGSGPAGVTPAEEDAYAAYPPDVVERALALARQRLLNPPTAAELPDVRARTQELTPMYAEILGTQDKDAVRSQMLFDIAQAALGFAGNVSPQGQPLTGSFAARLAGAASGLPGQISARSQAMRAAETQARLAALQQAQGERASAQETNREREKEYNELLLKAAGQKSFRNLSAEEKAAAGLPANEPWQIDIASGQYSLPGGRAATTTINTGAQTLTGMLGADFADTFKNARLQAEAATGTLRTIEEVAPLLASDELTFSGPFSGAETAIARLGTKLGVTEGDTQQRLANTVAAMRGLAEFELQAAQAMRGQGAITENERALIRRASGGDLATMTASEVRTLVGALEKTARWRIGNYNNMLDRVQTQVGAEEPLMSMYPKIELPPVIMQTTTPTAAPGALSVDPAAVQAELNRRQQAR